jgi:hypothetical protein
VEEDDRAKHLGNVEYVLDQQAVELEVILYEKRID